METKWKRTKDALPKDEEQVYCRPQLMLLTWNEYFQCWDDSEGDDFYCNRDEVESWVSIPEYDLKEE